MGDGFGAEGAADFLEGVELVVGGGEGLDQVDVGEAAFAEEAEDLEGAGVDLEGGGSREAGEARGEEGVEEVEEYLGHGGRLGARSIVVFCYCCCRSLPGAQSHVMIRSRLNRGTGFVFGLVFRVWLALCCEQINVMNRGSCPLEKPVCAKKCQLEIDVVGGLGCVLPSGCCCCCAMHAASRSLIRPSRSRPRVGCLGWGRTLHQAALPNLSYTCDVIPLFWIWNRQDVSWNGRHKKDI